MGDTGGWEITGSAWGPSSPTADRISLDKESRESLTLVPCWSPENWESSFPEPESAEAWPPQPVQAGQLQSTGWWGQRLRVWGDLAHQWEEAEGPLSCGDWDRSTQDLGGHFGIVPSSLKHLLEPLHQDSHSMTRDDSFTNHVASFAVPYFLALPFAMNLTFDLIRAVILPLSVTQKETGQWQLPCFIKG